MDGYQQAFGGDYALGIRIPDYFQDISYRHDTGPPSPLPSPRATGF